MADFLLIHIDNQFNVTQVITYDTAQNTAQKLPKEEFSSTLPSQVNVTILVPASWVYLTSTQVASRSSEILQKTIPFSIEDELINEVDDNYYAWQARSEHLQSVAVISKDKRHQINDFIKKHNLTVTGIYSEAVFCPAKENHLSLWQENQRILLRFGPEASMQCQEQQMPELIQAFGKNCTHLLTNKPDIAVASQFETVTNLSLTDCCANLLSGNEVNLYRGEDQDNERQTQSITWLKPLLAASFLIISWLIISAYQWWQLSTEIKDLRYQQQQILADKFNDLSVTEQRDPFAAMQSRLKQVNNENQPNSILLDSLYFLGEARQQHQEIEIKNIRLFDNNLEIQVTAPSISRINDYRQALQNQAVDYRVNIGVNELTDGFYQSIITIKPR